MKAILKTMIAFVIAIPMFVHADTPDVVAPTFDVPSINEKRVAYKPDSGQVTLVNFWASWCTPCALEFPQLNALAAEYAGKKLRVIAVSVDKKAVNANGFVKKRLSSPVAMEIGLDSDFKVAKSFAASAMPTSYIVDKKGKIRFVHEGFRSGDEKKWRNEIEQLLNE